MSSGSPFLNFSSMSNKALIYFTAGMVLLGISFGMQVHGLFGGSRKARIAKQISIYKDSIGQQRAKLLLIRMKVDLETDNNSQRLKLYSETIDERTAINKVLYGYQYKVDSLEMELGK